MRKAHTAKDPPADTKPKCRGVVRGRKIQTKATANSTAARLFEAVKTVPTGILRDIKAAELQSHAGFPGHVAGHPLGYAAETRSVSDTMLAAFHR